jgi:hypothetical protein
MGEYMNPKRHRKEKEGIPAFKIKEADVLRSVDRWLALKRIPHWRMNSGGLKDSHGRLVRFGAEGMADFCAVGPAPEGRSIWIECKRPNGGAVSAAQREFLDCINRHGGIGIVVDSIESLELQLVEAGVI